MHIYMDRLQFYAKLESEHGGTFAATKNCWMRLAKDLKSHGSIVFGYSKDRMGAMVISITCNFQKLGTLPFGGNPSGCAMVSVLGRGAFWFDMSCMEFSPSYVAEKMNLGSYDASILAELFENVFFYYREIE